MPKTIDLLGQRFGRLVVTEKSSAKLKGITNTIWKCICDCGQETLASSHHLRQGLKKSCGCLHAETARINGASDPAASAAANTTHGKHGTAVYRIWGAMIQRCTNPRNSAYKHYGGRGIKVCPDWLKSFEAFYEDMGDRPSKLHSLERVDNSGPYSKGNCVWALPQTQANNRRNNKYIIYQGAKMTVSEYAALVQISDRLAWYHLVKKNRPPEDAADYMQRKTSRRSGPKY